MNAGVTGKERKMLFRIRVLKLMLYFTNENVCEMSQSVDQFQQQNKSTFNTNIIQYFLFNKMGEFRMNQYVL